MVRVLPLFAFTFSFTLAFTFSFSPFSSFCSKLLSRKPTLVSVYITLGAIHPCILKVKMIRFPAYVASPPSVFSFFFSLAHKIRNTLSLSFLSCPFLYSPFLSLTYLFIS